MPLTANSFDFIRQLVLQDAGIVLDEGKEYLVESRLLPVAKSLGLDSIGALISSLQSTPRGHLRTSVVDAMTTNETLFFRDRHPFETLRDEVLSDLFARRQEGKHLAIWCAAASTGQEPYSVAVVLSEAMKSRPGWRVDLLATDISNRALERARQAEYSQLEVNRGVPAPLVPRLFQRRGIKYAIRPEIRDRVCFSVLNLVRSFPRMTPKDVVFLRNVLIYFDEKTKADILRRIRAVMHPDAYLFLGSSETMLNLDVPFERQTVSRGVVYRPC